MNTPLATLRATVALSFIILFAGCETVSKSVYTPSGKPEVTIRAPLAKIKAEIVADLMRHGYNVEADSDYMLRLSRPLSSGENFGAALSIGNAYSSNRRVTIYSFAQIDNEVKITVTSLIEAQMPGGQVNRQDMTTSNNSVYNTYQEQLMTIRDKLESTAKASAEL